MNQFKFLAMAAAVTLSACTANNTEKEDSADVIDRTEFTSPDGVFSIDALMALGRVSSPVVSPDGKSVLFGISYVDVEKNRSNNDLYVLDLDKTEPKRITRTEKSEGNAVWIASGEKIAFTYPTDKGNQLWVMNADGSDRKQVTDIEGGIEGFVFSPDEKNVVLIQPIKYAKSAGDIYPDLPKATGRVIDDLMYKHWDEWVTMIPHPFLGKFDGKKVTDIYDIMADEPFEAPMRPFGGAESFAWTKDSKQLIYVSRKKTGKEYALSTNSDLYLYDLESKTTKNLTEGMMGYDTNPIISPDGTKLAWLSMEHDGYESDKNRIFLMDLESGQKKDLTAAWDYHVDEIAWCPDGNSIYFVAPYNGVLPIFELQIENCDIHTVASGTCDFASLGVAGNDVVVALRHSMIEPNELVMVNKTMSNGDVQQLTDVNGDILRQITMPEVTQVMVPTTDHKEMLTWVVLPQNFDPNKKYPALLYCQGGPQSAVSQFWSYRWNIALMAANGYIVVAPNRRGLPGFGTEWNAQISKDYPGQNMKDYLSAIDFVKKNPYVDEKHIGATGASYGGFSIYWLAGNHNNRFAALLAHAGIFNLEAQYLETEEMWFANWDLGGAFWEKGNAAAQRTFAASPHRFVDKWTAPIMISHGELDYRILASQGMMAFNAAKLRNIPAEMVIFPDENHWILQPQNCVLWQRLFFRWFDRFLKDTPAEEAK